MCSRGGAGCETPSQLDSTLTVEKALVIVEAGLIAADIALGGPTGEGIVPAAGVRALREGLEEAAQETGERAAEGATRQGLMSSTSRDAITRHQAAPPSAGARAAEAARPTPSGTPGEPLPQPVRPTGESVGVPEPTPRPPRPESNPGLSCWMPSLGVVVEAHD